MTSTISSRGSSGTFFSASAIANATRASGRASTREPLRARPIGVRVAATIQASSIGHPGGHVDDLADECRLLLVLDLDLHPDRPDDARSATQRPRELRVKPNAGAYGHGAREADLLGAVVHAHHRVAHRDDLREQHRQHRQREVAVRDRTAERPVLGAFRIDVDPLVIARRVGEPVHLLLRDLVPRTRAEVAIAGPFQLVDGQRRRHLAPSRISNSRSALRSTFPTGVSGNVSTTWISRGYLYRPSRSLPKVRSSSAAISSCSVTKATTSSPCTSSARPTTHAVATAGCSTSASSTSRGKTLKPPRMIRSFLRSRIVRYPASSRRPMSPV